MNRYKFSTKNLNIKTDLLSKLIDSCLGCREMTRSEVSQLSCVSETTAGKLLSALDECRFTSLTYKRNPDGGSPQKLHSLSDNLSSLVIDLSKKTFSYSLIVGSGECKLYESRPFDPTVNGKENLTAFLSRVGAAVAEKKVAVSTVSVIVADESSSLPTLFKVREEICNFIAAFFGISPTLCIDRKESLAFAIKYNRINQNIESTRIAYILISDTPTAIFFPKSGDPITCSLESLMLTDRITAAEMLESATDENDVSHVLARISNLINCAYSPDSIIIEYEGIRIGAKTLSQIKNIFALTNSPLPELSISKCAPGLAHYGAAAASNAILIKKHIKGL